MAPRLAASQCDMIRDMILDNSLEAVEMAAAAGCSERTIRNKRSNMRCFGSTETPPNKGGRRRRTTPVMLDALREKPLEKPGMYQDEMIVFLFDEFDILVNASAVSRALASIGWLKKVTRQIAKEQNANLRGYYLHNLSAFKSHHLVYVDESGCDKRRSVWPQSRLRNLTGTAGIRFFLHMLRTVSCSIGCSRDRLIALCSQTLLKSFSSIAVVG
jgi:transposase